MPQKICFETGTREKSDQTWRKTVANFQRNMNTKLQEVPKKWGKLKVGRNLFLFHLLIRSGFNFGPFWSRIKNVPNWISTCRELYWNNSIKLINWGAIAHDRMTGSQTWYLRQLIQGARSGAAHFFQRDSNHYRGRWITKKMYTEYGAAKYVLRNFWKI